MLAFTLVRPGQPMSRQGLSPEYIEYVGSISVCLRRDLPTLTVKTTLQEWQSEQILETVIQLLTSN